MSKMVSVTIQLGVLIPDDVDLDDALGYEHALGVVADDIVTRGFGEIKESITDINYK